MANLATLQPTQTRRETKVHPSQILGGLFEDAFENLTGIPQSYEAREPVTTPVPEVFRKAFSSGSLENFQNPSAEALAETRKAEARANYLKNYNIVAEAEKVAENAEMRLAAAEQAHLEVTGMSDEALARKEKLQVGIRGKLLRNIYHFMGAFFTTLAEILKKKKAQSSPNAIMGNRASRINHFMQHNMAGERSGGHHFTSAVG